MVGVVTCLAVRYRTVTINNSTFLVLVEVLCAEAVAVALKILCAAKHTATGMAKRDAVTDTRLALLCKFVSQRRSKIMYQNNKPHMISPSGPVLLKKRVHVSQK
jgi:hypothetical protein